MVLQYMYLYKGYTVKKGSPVIFLATSASFFIRGLRAQRVGLGLLPLVDRIYSRYCRTALQSSIPPSTPLFSSGLSDKQKYGLLSTALTRFRWFIAVYVGSVSRVLDGGGTRESAVG